jgi:hypothetical protein
VLSTILNWMIGAVVGLAVSSAMHFGWIAGADPNHWVPTTLLSILAMAIIVAYRLPTKFMRALGVTLCHTAVVLAIAGVAMLIGISAAAAIAAVQ